VAQDRGGVSPVSLAVISIASATLVAVIGAAWRLGRWQGRADEKLDGLAERVERVERLLNHRDD
jgi:hypothetical protein